MASKISLSVVRRARAAHFISRRIMEALKPFIALHLKEIACPAQRMSFSWMQMEIKTLIFIVRAGVIMILSSMMSVCRTDCLSMMEKGAFSLQLMRCRQCIRVNHVLQQLILTGTGIWICLPEEESFPENIHPRLPVFCYRMMVRVI